MALVRRYLWGAIASVIVLAFLIALPHHASSDQTQVWSQAIFFGIAAMGLNVLTGYNGQVSLGHGAFFGLGAYASALLIHDHGWSFLPTLPVAALLCFVVGVLVGFPALRVKGLYLALVTLGLAVVFPSLINHYVHQPGGTSLVSLTAKSVRPPNWVPLWVSRIGRDDQWAYYVCLLFALIGVAGVYAIRVLRFGRSLIATRDHEAAAETVGINIAQTKVLAFGVSALYAGIAGSLSVLVAPHLASGTDPIVTFQLSIQFLVAVVVGGTATIVGPLIGAWFVVFLQRFITDYSHSSGSGFIHRQLSNPAAAPAIFGIVLILFVYVLPDGFVGGAKRLAARLRRRGPPRPAQPALTTERTSV
jgi:branched-chain amino acid transport system permease protein